MEFKFFSVTVDELLSTDEALKIVHEERIYRSDKVRDFVFSDLRN